MKRIVAGFIYLLVASALVCPHAARAASHSFGMLKYRGIGPAIAGGRTTAVAGSNVNVQVYYAGGAGGGVFKSTDGGSSWRPVFDSEPVAPIGAIAVAPRDPNDVWVGTGESNPRNDVEQGDGIWHSTNGGKTWTHLGLGDAGSISAISIDPRDPRRVAVAVLGQIFRNNLTRGVYVTTDDGAHWQHTLYAGPSIGASDLVRVPDRPDTLFAGMYNFRRKPWTMRSGGPGGGVFRSDDDGQTWHKIVGHGLPQGLTGRIGLAAGTRGRVYAVIQARGGDLWRSDDDGATWHVMPHSPLVGARRFYFSRIFVDPANNDRLISVGLILSMSTDGGKTFKAISQNDGWDYHVAWWSNDGQRVLVGSDEGLLVSMDSGAHWKQPYDLPFAQPYHVSYDDDAPNYHVCIGLQDDSSWCGWSNSPSGLGVLNRDWFTVGPGDGMWAMYDPKDPNFIWSTSTASDTGQVYLYNVTTHQTYEVSPEAQTNSDRPARATRYRFNWDSPIAFESDGTALVGGNVVFASSDRGMHWTAISPDLTRNDRAHQRTPGGPIDADMSGAETADDILDIEVSKVADGVIWVGTDDGLVQVTRDGGAHWSNVTPPIFPHWGRVATVDASPFDAATAFAAVDNHMLGDDHPYLFETTDYGAHWRSIDGDLPKDLFARVVRQDPRNPNLLYAGTQRGVWASWDDGRHWQSLRLNMPATAIYDIEIDTNTNDLIVAAHGRGVWILDDITAVQHPANPTRAHLFPIRQTYRWYASSPINSFSDGLPANEFAGPNVDYGALITYWLPHAARNLSIEILDANGRVVRHLRGKDAPGHAGLNRTAWDLQEDGPIRWMGTYEQNRGPQEGADVVPGIYTVRLAADGRTLQQSVDVLQDPRDRLTADQMQLSHDTLERLYDEVSGVDAMLNTIDKRLPHANGAMRGRLLAFRSRLTYNPRNVEDLGGPAGLREKLLDLIGRISGSSLQPPTQTQLDYAAHLHAEYLRIRNAARAVIPSE
jgi:photosystem II stability/assembly factor-like uncharacterized protein